MSSPRDRKLAVFLVWFTLCAARHLQGAELPSESTLPGVPEITRNFPAESLLPASYVALQEEIPPPPPELPDESSLPRTPETPQSEPQDREQDSSSTDSPAENFPPPAEREAEDDLLQLGRSPDARPWLRLNLRGHVGPVRALVFSQDSQRLFTAGEDKAVLVWSRVPGANASDAWSFERAFRWQIQRGLRGRIYALAVSGDLLAVAGHGAMGGNGEIVLINHRTGNLVSALTEEETGHRQVILSLAFSPDPAQPGLVSQDRDGRVLCWRPDAETGVWRGRQIVPPDAERFPNDVALLTRFRGTAPIAMRGARHAIVPVFVGRVGNVPTWRLYAVDVETGRLEELPGGRQATHQAMVSALSITADGSRLASADFAGNLFWWDLQRASVKVAPANTNNGQPYVSLAFDGLGNRLIAGTGQTPSEGAVAEIWDTSQIGSPRKLGRSLSAPSHVYACAASPDGSAFAHAHGPDVVTRYDTSGAGRRLRAPVLRPRRVAFAAERPFYRVAFGVEEGELSHAFDAEAVQLSREASLSEKDWLPASWLRSGWEIRPVKTPTVTTFWLFEDGRQRARIPFDPTRQGNPSSECWISDTEGRPFAVAVGTTGDGNIYVLRLAAEGDAPVIRVLRGHTGEVLSLAVSRDLRYLVSSSTDSTLRFWALRHLAQDGELINRWGADFEIVEEELVVRSPRPDGPLYFRGMREGDVIQKLRWATGLMANGRVGFEETEDPEAMLRALRERPFSGMILFEYTRGRAPARRFQMYPAWQPLASLVVSEEREWAFWTPSGYYDASFEGHKLFGWQVNRGLERLPDFFLAAQLRNALERPDVMSRLLDSGSVDGAFQSAFLEVPPNALRAVEDAYHLKPEVEILRPRAGELVAGSSTEIEAAITVGSLQQLAPPKAYANGVVALDRALVRVERTEEGQRYIYRWRAALPSEQRIRLQVFAATEDEIADSASVEIRRESSAPLRRPKLFIATAGVNQYVDAQLPRLDFPVSNARTMAETLRDRAAPIYDGRAVSLVNDRVTRPAWSATLVHYAERLRAEASPDDLLVVFWSGHGVRDPQTGQYYYVTSGTRYADLRARRFGDCMSLEDLTALADVPCRKLVILDTCHSGAIQPDQQRAMKAALRALQDDVIFTLTASEGDQEAVDGRFTKRLLAGLSGQADSANGDGVVEWRELVEYVRRTVAADSAADAYQQFPTAGPRELLDVVEMPLTAGDPKLAALWQH